MTYAFCCVFRSTCRCISHFMPFQHVNLTPSLVQSATLVMMVFGLGNGAGLLLGGVGGSFLYSIDPRFPPILAGSAAILGCIPFWYLLNDVNGDSHLWFISIIAIVAGVSTMVTGVIAKATLQNVTSPQLRGQAFAIMNLSDDFGQGLGPAFISAMIATMGNRTTAFNWGVLGWAFCGMFNLLMFCTVTRDEARLYEEIVEQLSQRTTSFNEAADLLPESA